MTDFTLVKKYLLEIDDLPKINDRIGNNWRSIIDEIRPLKDVGSQLKTKIEERKNVLYQLLISAPTCISVSRKENQRLIILIVFILDELGFYKDQEHWREYLEFRYKVFDLFVKNDLDAEAAELFKNLIEIKSALYNQPQIKSRIQNQENNSRRKIGRKIKELETLKQFGKASQLNTMYGTVPNYIYEPRIEEKEKKHFEWHFLQPVYKIIIEVLFFLFVYGINQLVLKKYEHGDLFSFFSKGNFSIYEMLYGFALIFFLFWIFKLLDHQSIKNLWKNILKGTMIIIALIVVDVSIIQKYNAELNDYFPNEHDKKVVRGEYNNGKTRVLVTKFNPLVEHSVFNANYSEINVSQLFYKKMLAQNQSDHGLQDTNLVIDYYPECYTIKNMEEFDRFYTQKKYDAIISGEFLETKNEVYTFNSLSIINEEFQYLLNHYLPVNNKFISKSPDNNRLNSKNFDELRLFVTYFVDPILYYKEIYKANNTSNYLCAEISSMSDFCSQFHFDFNPDISFLLSINKSPIISYCYIKVLKDWEINKRKPSDDQLLIIIQIIDKMLAEFSENIQINNKDSTKYLTKDNNIELLIHLMLLKTYFINERIILKLNAAAMLKENYDIVDEVILLWYKKIEIVRKILEITSFNNNMKQFDIDFLQASFIYINYNYLGKVFVSQYNNNSPNSIFTKQLKYETLNIIGEYENKYRFKKYQTHSDSMFFWSCFKMKEKLMNYVDSIDRVVINPYEIDYYEN